MKIGRLTLGIFIAAIIEFSVIGGVVYAYRKNIENKKVEIYTVFHKPWEIYRNDIVIPIHAGRALGNPQEYPLLKEMIGDDTGDNISPKNRKYSELTVLYWMWKNSNADYVGLMHYRRYLNLSQFMLPSDCHDDLLCKYGLKKENVLRIMKDVDIVAIEYTRSFSMYYDFASYHFPENMEMVLDYLREHYPKEFIGAGQVLMSKQLYGCNMFLMKKEILDKYAAWLFEILFALEEKFVYTNWQSQFGRCTPYRDQYNLRIPSFVGERLFAFWLKAHEKEYNIVKVPLSFVGDN